MKMNLKGAAIAAMMSVACAASYAQSAPKAAGASKRVIVDQVVAVVGSSAILYSEVDQVSHQLVAQRREQGYTSDRDPINEALEYLMTQKLLYNQSLIDSVQVSLNDLDKLVEESVQREIKVRGSIAAVEAYYRKPIYDFRDDLRQRATEERHAEMMRYEITDKVTITPGEVDRFARRINKDSLPLVPERYVYAQITKFPPSMQQAKQRVREKLLDLRERILNGANFATLARRYSVDGSAVRGGEMDPATRENFVTPFSDAFVKLKPGQVSEVVETEFGFHIIQLIDKKDNLYHVRHILLRPEYTAEELEATITVLDSIATTIRNGQATFEKAALENSDDKYSKLNGGIVSNHEVLEVMYGGRAGAQYTKTQFNKEELSRISVNDYMAISAMQIGDVSKPFLTEDLRGNQLAKIVKLLQIIPTHQVNVNEDYLDLEQLALQDKQQKEFTKWLNKKIETMYIRIDPAFRSGDFENKTWLK